jgi:hypothetical protein
MTVSTLAARAYRAQPSPRAPSQCAEHTPIYIHKHLPTAFQAFRYIVSPLYTLCTLSLGMAVLPLADGAPVTLPLTVPLTVPLTSPCTSRLLSHAASDDQAHGLITAGSHASERYECSRTRERLVTTMADTKSANWKSAKSMTSAEPKSATL